MTAAADGRLMTEHTCHAEGCTRAVPPRLFMCKPHWRMVPPWLKSLIWHTYRPGQEIRKDPTPEYLDVARKAIAAAAEKDGLRLRGVHW